MKIIDISVPLDRKLPVWPKTKGFRSTVNNLATDLHVGTHLDAPLHFIKNGLPMNKIPLENFIGEALVMDLKNINKLPENAERVLFKTSNSRFWQKRDKKFHENYVGLSIREARFLVKKKVKLVGIDYLSIAKFEELKEVHRILLKDGIVILESINLSAVTPGRYELISLPLKLIGTEAAPARAILLKR